MKLICALVWATLAALATGVTSAQTDAKGSAEMPLATDICQILSRPYAYNNKIVKVRGFLSLGSEYSLLVDERCDALWLMFADGSVPPQLVATVSGVGTVGSKDAAGRRVPPVPVRVARDANWEQLENYISHNARAESCAKEPPNFDHLSDCKTYRLTATFTGRIDAVSKSVYESRLKRKANGGTDWRGFGQMGLFDAQIVVESVADVVATEEAEVRRSNAVKR